MKSDWKSELGNGNLGVVRQESEVGNPTSAFLIIEVSFNLRLILYSTEKMAQIILTHLL